MHVRCPHCQSPIESDDDPELTRLQSCHSCGSQFNLVDGSTTVFSPGGQILHFDLIAEVGFGGSGSVWKAKDRELDRFVAVKIPRREYLSPEETERFLREARAAAQLNHPRIVSVHEVGCVDGQPFIVSDFIPGATLGDRMKTRRSSAKESAELCAKIADALHHAHEHGIVHRDLKPSNILIDLQHEPHLNDFGLAKRDAGEVTMTVDGQVIGTPAYMAPEQARGDARAADRRTDIYSLGVVLFELLTGERPFRGNSRMLLLQILSEEPPNPRKLNGSVPRDLETICLKCLQKEPSHRYATAEEISLELRRFLAGQPIQARPISAVSRSLRWCKRNREVAGLMAAVAGALILGTLASLYFAIHWMRSERTTRESLATELLTHSRLLRETRPQGYGVQVDHLLHRVADLGPEAYDQKTLRHEAIQTQGDFVSLQPFDIREFDEDLISIGWHPREPLIAAGFDNGMVRLRKPHDSNFDIELNSQAGAIIALGFDKHGDRLSTVHHGADESVSRLTQWRPDGNASGRWTPEKTLSLDEHFDSARIARGEYLLAHTSKAVAVWRLADLSKIAEIDAFELQVANHSNDETDKGMIRGVAIHPDGQQLVIAFDHADASGNLQGFVVWDIAHDEPVRKEVLNLGSQYANSIAFSDDGKFFVFGCDQALVLYELPEFRQKASLGQDSIRAVAISPYSQYVAGTDIRGEVRLWSVSSGKVVANLAIPIYREDTETALRFGHGGDFLAVSNLDGIRLWNLGGTPEKRLLPGHAGPVPTIAAAPGGRTFATGSKDESVIVRDVETYKPKYRLNVGGPVQSIRYSPDGRFLAVAHWGVENQPVLIHSVSTGELLATATHSLRDITRIAFADDQHLVASASLGMAIWDLPIASFDIPGNEQSPSSSGAEPIVIEPSRVEPGIRCLDVAVHPEQPRMVWTVKSDNHTKIRLLDWKNDQESTLLQSPAMKQGWHGLAMSANNELFYVGESGQIIRWDVSEGRILSRIGQQNQFRAPHIALSHDGRLLAALHEQDAVSVWNTQSGEERYAFRSERGAIWSIEWLPGAETLLLGLNDGGLVVWDLNLVEENIRRYLATD